MKNLTLMQLRPSLRLMVAKKAIQKGGFSLADLNELIAVAKETKMVSLKEARAFL